MVETKVGFRLERERITDVLSNPRNAFVSSPVLRLRKGQKHNLSKVFEICHILAWFQRSLLNKSVNITAKQGSQWLV